MKNLDFQLLKNLYCIFSPSMEEKKMRRFIKRYIATNVPHAKVKQDTSGNLLITKGEADTYPCLCAHMDQVQRFHPKDFCCVDSNGVIFGYSPKTRKQCGLGADDKNGLYVALTCLKEYDILKCAFFVGEEIGCVGSGEVDVSFFNDCRFCVQIDRRGHGDMVTNISLREICSEKFVMDAGCEPWGYSISSGLMTDVEELRHRGVLASCINLSCGYYEPHTDCEFTVKADVQKCYNFVCHIIESCTGDYAFVDNPANDDYGWGKRTHYAGWEYDECMDVCCRVLETNPQTTQDDFVESAKAMFPSLKTQDLVEIYQVSKTFS